MADHDRALIAELRAFALLLDYPSDERLVVRGADRLEALQAAPAPAPAPTRDYVERIKAHRAAHHSDLKTAKLAVDDGWLPAPSPAALAGVSREEIARVIDPEAWARREPWRLPTRQELALAKADAILALASREAGSP